MLRLVRLSAVLADKWAGDPSATGYREEMEKLIIRYEDALIEIADARGFDNIGKWSRRKAKDALTFLPNTQRNDA